ncbi:pyridoxamine 5'-phosphate oxidase family protein [Saezia sanguinis]|uniref:pyridoxamine 5'-phosphate oxidase family protein n=1 Tax=Saezia sanguinis TaxID=1965230 RepID=UPI003048839A
MGGKFSALVKTNQATLTDRVKNCIERSIFCWLATVDRNGEPHVSPREIFAAHEDTYFLIANVFSPGSIRNIRGNPKVSVSFVDMFLQQGFKLQGQAMVVSPVDAVFKNISQPLFLMANREFPIHNIISIQVEDVTPLIAPSYKLMPEVVPEAQARLLPGEDSVGHAG